MTERLTGRFVRRRALAAVATGLLAAGVSHTAPHMAPLEPIRAESHAPAPHMSAPQHDHAEPIQKRPMWRAALTGVLTAGVAAAVLFPRSVAKHVVRGAKALARAGGPRLAGVLALLGVGLILVGLVEKVVGLFVAAGAVTLVAAGWVALSRKSKNASQIRPKRAPAGLQPTA